MATIQQYIRDAGLDIAVETSVCMGRCNDGPTVKLAPRGEFVKDATEENIKNAMLKFISNA